MDREQIEKMSRDYGMLQEQRQSLAIQREQLSNQKLELENAAKEVEKASGKIYQAIGNTFIEVEKDHALKRIKESAETVELHFNMVSKQYDETTKKELSLRNEINAAMKGGGGVK